MKEKIIEMIDKMKGKEMYISEVSHVRYSNEFMVKKYYALYEELIAKQMEEAIYEDM